MAEPILLVDSDVFALLAAVGLLGELATSLGLSRESVRRLPALVKQLQQGKSIGRKYPDAQREQALSVCKSTRPFVARAQEVALQARLVRVDNIDDGEAVLFATLAEQPFWYLTTGDQRSLIALGQAAELADVRERVSGRILCLETVLLLLIQRLGAAEIGARFQPIQGVHTKIDIFFGYKETFDDATLIDQITSYLSDLRKNMGCDILYPL
jgi:hypothetical protein